MKPTPTIFATRDDDVTEVLVAYDWHPGCEHTAPRAEIIDVTTEDGTPVRLTAAEETRIRQECADDAGQSAWMKAYA